MHWTWQLMEVVFFKFFFQMEELDLHEMALFLEMLKAPWSHQVVILFNQRLPIPEGVTEINVSADGLVSVQVAGEAEAAEVGQLTLANFANPAGLQPIGENFAVETPASGAPAIGNPFGEGFGKLIQGSLEASNINVVQELVDMIETQRAYEVSSKSISAVDEMMRFVSNNL